MLKKLKSIFIVEDVQVTEDIQSQKPDTQNAQSGSPQAVPVSSPRPPVHSETLSHSGDEKFNNILLKVLEDNNIEGFDYLEFKNSVMSLSKAIPDEATQFRSAYEVGKTMGITKEKLLETANYYAGLLKQEESKFLQAFENQKQQQLHGREEEIKKYEKEILVFEQKIKELTESIHQHRKTIDELRTAMAESTEKLSHTHSSFHASYVRIHDKIVSDINKIQNLLT